MPSSLFNQPVLVIARLVPFACITRSPCCTEVCYSMHKWSTRILHLWRGWRDRMEPNHPLWVAWREMLPPVLHQALQRPSTFEQTGLELELVHSAGFRPWDVGGGGGGGGERRSGAGLQKKYFWPFGPQFGLKIRGGGHLGHSAGSATGSYLVYVTRYTFGSFSSPITSSLFSCWFISLKKNTHTRS